MRKPTSVTFFYPARTVGGIETLFVRLARHLAREKGRRVVVLDFENGFIRQQLAGEPIAFESCTYESRTTLEPGTFLVTSLEHYHTVDRVLEFPPDTRMLFWGLHPQAAYGLAPIPRVLSDWPTPWLRRAMRLAFRREWNRARANIDFLLRHEAWAFMDHDNIRIPANVFSFEVGAPNYLPLAVEAVPLPQGATRDRSPELGWLGRLEAPWNTESAIRVLNDAARWAEGRPERLKIHLISAVSERLKQRILSRIGAHHNLAVLFRGRVVASELDRVLRDDVDVLFAHGTAALEGAKLAIPTALVDGSTRPLPREYRYRWLHDAEPFDLGRLLLPGDRSPPGVAFGALMDASASPETRRELGVRSYNSCHSNHSVPSVADRLLTIVDTGGVSYTDLKNGGFLELTPMVRAWRGLRAATSRIRRLGGPLVSR